MSIKIVGQMDLSKFFKKSKEVQQPVKVVKSQSIYSQQEIHFFEDRNKKIVGRLETGKIAIISFDYKGVWVNNGDTWMCDIVEEQEKKVIVHPKYIVKTSEDNFKDSVIKIQELKNKGFNKEFKKPKNSRLYYQSK
jgi:hypothetical protein